MRFPTVRYVRPAKPQISLRIHAVWSEPLLVAWIFYDHKATDRTSFGVYKLKGRLHRLVWVYTCRNATLLEIVLQLICCGYSLEASNWEAFNEYHKKFFSKWDKKTITIFIQKKISIFGLSHLNVYLLSFFASGFRVINRSIEHVQLCHFKLSYFQVILLLQLI